MIMRSLLIALSLVGAASCGPTTPPPVFAHKSLAEARAEVAGTPKVLIVKATASWCGPCREMNKTTWRDPRVETWVAANGLAIELDTDDHAAEAKALHVTALPTMIAFRGGEEFDRIVGFRDADQLLAWMEAVKSGERAGLSGRGGG